MLYSRTSWSCCECRDIQRITKIVQQARGIKVEHAVPTHNVYIRHLMHLPMIVSQSVVRYGHDESPKNVGSRHAGVISYLWQWCHTSVGRLKGRLCPGLNNQSVFWNCMQGTGVGWGSGHAPIPDHYVSRPLLYNYQNMFSPMIGCHATRKYWNYQHINR